MHRMYECVWKWAENISKRCPFRNKSWFLFFNICIWAVIGLIIAVFPVFIINIAESSSDKWTWEIVTAGYAATVAGFGGGIMYILRNTNPDDIK